MKKMFQVMAMLVSLTMAMTTGVSAAILYDVPSGALFNQSFAGLSAAPDGWTLSGDYTFLTDGVSVTANGKSARIGSDSAFDVGGQGYEITFSVSKPGINTIACVAGASSAADATTALTETKGALTAAPTGYTIRYDNALNPALFLYKNGVQIGTEQAWATQYLPNNSTLKLTVTADSVKATMTNTDSPQYSVSITVPDQNPIYSGYTGVYFGAVNTACKLYGVSAVTLPGQAAIENFKLSKTFSAADTIEGVKAAGWDVSATSAVAENGLRIGYNAAAGTNLGGSDKLLFDQYDLSGSYTVESSFHFTLNSAGIYLNYKDAQNYYLIRYGRQVFDTDNSKRDIAIFKYVNGAATVSECLTPDHDAATFTYSTMPNKVVVTNSGGAITFDIYFQDSLGNPYTATYTDSVNIIPSGKVGIGYFASSANYVKEFKAYPGGAEPDVQGIYSVGQTPVQSLVKGATSLEIPTKLVGTNNVIVSALYVNREMADIIMFDMDDFMSGGQDLFDTANIVGGDVQIRTYIWNSLEQLMPLAAPSELK